MDKWIWLDMDGTIADLYSVENWLADLIAFDVRPYAIAKPIYNTLDILEVLSDLKSIGYKIGIISWVRVAKAKEKWLIENNCDIVLDKIIVTPYGICKADTCRQFGKGILVDDEEQNRKAWDLGETIDATQNIIKNLKKLLTY